MPQWPSSDILNFGWNPQTLENHFSKNESVVEKFRVIFPFLPGHLVLNLFGNISMIFSSNSL
jgi:hypothetical protein